MCSGACVCACVYMEARRRCEVFFPHCSPPVFVRQGLSLILECIDMLGWSTSDLQGSIYVCSTSTGVTDVHLRG